ncbi:hypothetical protein CRE_08544 [Caenorhabditis remanei]|uniref:BTB domain-containing protein n=1 Tax=Caenorhabditis remanei TaxID=31234 RepID=E3NB94_CAERE|nr:hypothetical protein CRE_08544 [Caenorhabditis remanei]
MSREAAENEEKRIKNTLSEWTVEKFLDMRKELLDRQKDLEKSNMEMAENLKLSDEKFENLSNELQEKMDKIIEALHPEASSKILENVRLSDEKMERLSKKFDSIQCKLNQSDKTLKPVVSSEIQKLSNKHHEKFDFIQRKLAEIENTLKPEVWSEIIEKIKLSDENIEKQSKEHQEKFDWIQWKLNEIEKLLISSNIVENNDSGKYFVLKHTFNNVSSFENNKNYFSEEEEHFGVPWQINVKRNNGFLELYLWNSLLHNTEKKWEIEVEFELKIVSPSSREKKEKRRGERVVFKSDDNASTWGYREFIKWDELEKEFVIDNCFCAEITVKVKKMTGIYKENMRSFDKTIEEYSDVVLIVNDEKFYVLKMILATDSPYFKNLFIGKSNETETTVIQLLGIDADDFQKYLEVLYGKQAIDEFTVEGILMVADKYATRVVIEKCENFLQYESKKKLKTKLQLSKRYNLAALMSLSNTSINSQVQSGVIPFVFGDFTTIMSRKSMEEEEVSWYMFLQFILCIQFQKRIKNTLTEWTVEKFLDMRKELMDRQKDLEKSNMEMVEKVEKLSNELQGKMDKIVEALHPEASSDVVEKIRLCDDKIENLSKELQSKLNQIDETLKTEVSSEIVEKIRLSDEKIEQLSKEHQEKFDSIQSKLNEIFDTLKPEASSEIEMKIRLCDEKIEKQSKKFDSIQSKLNQIDKTLKPVVSSEIGKLSSKHQEKFDSIQSKLDEITETLKPEVWSEIVEKIKLSDEKIEKLRKEQQENFVRFDMRKELLNKQKDIEKSNYEIVEKIKLSDEKIENLSKDHREKLDSIQSKLNEIDKTLKPKVSSEIEKLSKEHLENFDSIQSKLDKVVETLKPEVSSKIEENNDPATSGKYFVLKHTFNNVSSFENGKYYFSEEEEHFGVPW